MYNKIRQDNGVPAPASAKSLIQKADKTAGNVHLQSRKNSALLPLGCRQQGGFEKGLMIALTNSALEAYFPGKERHKILNKQNWPVVWVPQLPRYVFLKSIPIFNYCTFLSEKQLRKF